MEFEETPVEPSTLEPSSVVSSSIFFLAFFLIPIGIIKWINKKIVEDIDKKYVINASIRVKNSHMGDIPFCLQISWNKQTRGVMDSFKNNNNAYSRAPCLFWLIIFGWVVNIFISKNGP